MALFNINKPGWLCPWQARRCISGRALQRREEDDLYAATNARHFSLSNLNSVILVPLLDPLVSRSSARLVCLNAALATLRNFASSGGKRAFNFFFFFPSRYIVNRLVHYNISLFLHFSIIEITIDLYRYIVVEYLKRARGALD